MLFVIWESITVADAVIITTEKIKGTPFCVPLNFVNGEKLV